jgi:hypothetical protein
LAFSICLGQEGGLLGIGGMNYNKHLNATPIWTVPLSRTSAQYNINIHKLTLNGVDSGLRFADFDLGQGSFLDSGSTVLYAHGGVFQYVHLRDIQDDRSGFRNVLFQFCAKDPKTRCGGNYRENNMCFEPRLANEIEFFNSFPSYEFHLDNDVVLEWLPESYLVKESKGEFCLGIEAYEYLPMLEISFIHIP